VTLSVLELVKLTDMFRFIVVYWVKGMNWIELAEISISLSCEDWKITSTINRRKLLSSCDRLPFVPQAVSEAIYIQLVNKSSSSSAEVLIDSFIPAVPHVILKPKAPYNGFSRSPMFLYKEGVEQSF
jgi:hypothetical protein